MNIDIVEIANKLKNDFIGLGYEVTLDYLGEDIYLVVKDQYSTRGRKVKTSILNMDYGEILVVVKSRGNEEIEYENPLKEDFKNIKEDIERLLL
jgi:3'-phosphoadenosine 5'-phosphosulfate sulfotransferase